jgi:hypothetical protein
MKLDYAPAPTPHDRRLRRIVLRVIAGGLLLGGLFFGLAETVVLVLRMLAVGPFSDLGREPLAVRLEDTILVAAIAGAGYAVAIAGYLLDRSQVSRRPIRDAREERAGERL